MAVGKSRGGYGGGVAGERRGGGVAEDGGSGAPSETVHDSRGERVYRNGGVCVVLSIE